MRDRIDLNADLGEERGGDAEILPHLSSANIACGAHAGGIESMDAALALAAFHGVQVGAHVSYADREGFGRSVMDVDRDTLMQSIVAQIMLLQSRATAFGLVVRYVKPHGALYHEVASNVVHARALVDAVRAAEPTMDLLAPASPMLTRLASPLRCHTEFFADRAYTGDGTLVPRGMAGAIIEDTEQIVARTLRWLERGHIETIEGDLLRLEADSICLHGDEPQAVRTASALRDALDAANVRVCPWSAP